MKSFTVRLRPDDVKTIRLLRDAGVNVADVFRSSLAMKQEEVRRGRRKWTKQAIDEVFAEIDQITEGLPPPEWVQRGINVTDRRQMRAYVREKLLRKRKGQ